MPGTLEPPCELATTHVLIDEVVVADDNSPNSADVDGDGRPDSALASVWLLLEHHGAELSAAVDAAFADMGVLWVMSVDRCSSGEAYSRVSLRRGISFDGRVLLHEEAFVPSVGTWTEGIVSAEDGALRTSSGIASAPLTTFFEREPVGDPPWIAVAALAVEATVRPDGQVDGRIGFAIEEQLAHTTLAEPLSRTINSMIREDTGCLDDCLNPISAIALEDYDLDGSGSIEPSELLQPPGHLLASLWRADIDLLDQRNGQSTYWPNRDGHNDHVSFGFAFRAVPVTAHE